MNIVPFTAAHFAAIDPQPAQASDLLHATPELLRSLEGPRSFTGLVEGRPVWCFGWLEVHAGRALLWAYMDRAAGRHFVSIHRTALGVVDALPHRRIEIEVACEFEQGHRWARMLGMEPEALRLRGFRADGGDSALYAKVRS